MNENDIFWKKKKRALVKCFIGTGLFLVITIIMVNFPSCILWYNVPLGCVFLFFLTFYMVGNMNKALNWPPPHD